MGKIYKNGILFAGSTENARSVAFDNTDTGIEADNVQGAIEEIKDDVSDIKSNLKWKLIDTIPGGDYEIRNIDFSQYDEILIAFKYTKQSDPENPNAMRNYTIYIPKLNLTQAIEPYQVGCYQNEAESANNVMFSVKISLSSIEYSRYSAYINKQNIQSNTILKIYAR